MEHDGNLEAVRLGRKVRMLRRARNLPIDALAERLGIDKGSLSRIENGHKDVRISFVRRLAEKLGVTIHDLLET